jgi:hypothetical protein
VGLLVENEMGDKDYLLERKKKKFGATLQTCSINVGFFGLM